MLARHADFKFVACSMYVSIWTEVCATTGLAFLQTAPLRKGSKGGV